MSGNQHRRTRRNIAAASAIGLVAVAGIAGAASAGGSGSAAPSDRWSGVYALTDDEVAAIRAWAEPFADPAAAEAAGMPNLDLCFDHMGDHYADAATFGDAVLDPAKPEALVYADVDGATKLVAVEWVSTAPGAVAGIPLHLNHDLDVWVLHAWIGVDNPAGMLADHNPNVGACPT
jgi:hypothetical protein